MYREDLPRFGSSSSFNIGVTLNPAQGFAPSGFSVGGSLANGNRKYTDTPTTLVAEDQLTAYAGRLTTLAAAGLWSKSGKLKLDTADLAFDHFSDKDSYVAVAGSLSVSNHSWDGLCT